MEIKRCRICKSDIVGRLDKVFCSVKCKNAYHSMRRRQNELHVREVDNVLHRNRIILLELSEKKKFGRFFIDKQKLIALGFKFEFCTKVYHAPDGKIYHYVYDFAWTDYAKNEIMILMSNYASMAV